jgi:hypothetical protein
MQRDRNAVVLFTSFALSLCSRLLFSLSLSHFSRSLSKQLTACGKPYLKPKPVVPPSIGSGVSLDACDNPATSMVGKQKWTFGSDGKITLTANSSLCITEPKGCAGNGCYPLKLAACADADAFEHDARTSEIKNKRTLKCVDASNGKEGAGDLVGAWECGSSDSQPNQHFAVDSSTGNIVSLSQTSASSEYAPNFGLCLTA